MAVALILTGAGVTGYPVAETLVTNHELSRDAYAYSEALVTSDPRPRDAQLLRAQQYNARLTPQLVLDPWGNQVPDPNAAHQDYLGQLNEFEVMARLRIPRIKVDLSIFHDATKAQLAKGVGHMYGTSLPIGGVGNHAVLAAHTGIRSATMFDRLRELGLGDQFSIDVYGQTLTYRVDQTSVVEPDDVRAVAPVPGADYVTLLTCTYSTDHHTRRLLVRGVRVPLVTATDPPQVQPAPAVGADETIQSWMPPRIAGTGIAIGLAAVLLIGSQATDRRRILKTRPNHKAAPARPRPNSRP